MLHLSILPSLLVVCLVHVFSLPFLLQLLLLSQLFVVFVFFFLPSLPLLSSFLPSFFFLPSFTPASPTPFSFSFFFHILHHKPVAGIDGLDFYLIVTPRFSPVFFDFECERDYCCTPINAYNIASPDWGECMAAIRSNLRPLLTPMLLFAFLCNPM